MPLDLLALDESEIAALVQELGQPAYRARQLHRWLHEHRVLELEEMSNLPRRMREALEARARIGSLEQITEQCSEDGTRKRLYRLADGPLVESVLMPYADGRRTACISTQAGCAMGCVFCATGQMGFTRNLSIPEIFEQAWRWSAELGRVGERLSNVVLMGMGEPFHNYEASLDAIRRIMRDLGIGARHITVSTVGLVPEILRFAEEGLQVGLAISLHAATDARRSALLPVGRRWPLEELIAACRTYVERSGRRISFEWALIAGENDRAEDARQLAERLRGLHCHVNLIPLNPTAGFAGDPAGEQGARRMVEILEAQGIPATVRMRRGIDIDAGCGQLRDRVVGAEA